MGVVYGARDTKLGRNVALKLLPEAVTTDSDRLQRFRREARLLAGLNHPNIATIYGLEEPPTGAPFLVLERVEGASLASHLEDGPLPLADALPIARSIALALEAAHERGVVHRDLKPANVMVSPSGVVKLLDFGVARWVPRPEAVAGGGDNATTMANFTETLHDQRVGTPAYMSPAAFSSS
jgi:serine/threonine-protein kinase